MTEPVPKFMESEYFTDQPRWRLRDGAPERLKKEFERYFNSKTARAAWKSMNPQMRHPYYTWTGEIIDQ